MGGDEFCVLAPLPGDLDRFGQRCASALALSGDGFSITSAHGVVVIPGECAEPSAALALADARMYSDKNTGRRPASHQSAAVLLATVQERAPQLADRMHEVEELACAVAAELGLRGDDYEALRYAAALHDIGKLAIPEAILEKPGPLAEAEWALIRRHTLIGERILAAAPALERSARLVRWTHERPDGGGYPDGLRGDDIPLAARIIAAVDAFSAITSARPYRPARTPDEALAELRGCAPGQFDDAVVCALTLVLARDEVAPPVS
jgi:HD-GYP domain-containing protein (c-di-GMP phosphodiesterase class II)